jgi:hypothetical protein
MLVIMTIDHLDLYGPVYRFSYETVGFASAAEAFVLLSGIVAGLVYTRYAEVPGELGPRVRRRLVSIYRYHLLVVAGLLAYWLLHPLLRPEGGLPAAGLNALGGALLLNQEPPLDILPLYLLFVAALPLILGGFRRGLTVRVLGFSAALWALDQALTLTEGYPWHLRFVVAGVPVHWQPNHFHLLAWQFLFVLGVWGGWRYRGGGRRLLRPAPWPLVGLALGVVALGMALRHGIGLPELAGTRLEVGRVNLGWLRLVNVGLLAWLLVQVGARRPGLLHVSWLELLGRHSLQVFAWQSVLQLLLRPHYLDIAEQHGLPARLVLLTLAVASLTLPALAHQTWRRRRVLAES